MNFGLTDQRQFGVRIRLEVPSLNLETKINNFSSVNKLPTLHTLNKMKVYLVIHTKHPTYSMYMNRGQYSEDIETINSEVIGVYSSYKKAEAKARRFFFNELGLTHSDDCELDGLFCYDADGEDVGTFMETVDVEMQMVE